jgi:LacI family transcriptional regulator
MSSITIRQIALEAGCSRTTVSLALRNHPRIPAKTRRMILDLATQMGYRRDPMMSTLMTRMRTAPQNRAVEKLAYLTWWDSPESQAKPPRDTLGFEGACRRARELGYEMEEYWAKAPGLSTMRLNKILHARGVRGVIVGTLPRPLGHVRLEWSRLASVMIGFSIANHGVHRVGTDHFRGMILAVRNLKHRGYKNIGFSSLTDQSERANQGWLAGYLTYQYRQPQHLRIPPLIVSQWDRTKFSRWMKKYRPDAMVSNIEEPLASLRQLGYQVPEDVGFASLDRMYLTNPYAGIDQLRGQVNVAAVELLVAQLENHQFGLSEHPRTVSVDGVWRDGPTVCAVQGTG